jgi:TIR domain-containing protein
MKVFISWSGDRSRVIAESLRSWLPMVLQSLKPWMSDTDIAAGSRWKSDVAGELAAAKAGVICLTPENQVSPWLLFEAGALSKTLEDTYVCPLLHELSPSEVTGPIAQFQANQLSREGMERVLATLNRALGANQQPPETIPELLEVWWPKLAQRLKTIPPLDQKRTPRRSANDMLEEILANTREQVRRENARVAAFAGTDQKFAEFAEMFKRTVATQARAIGSSGTTEPSMQEFASWMKAIADKSRKLTSDLQASSSGALTPSPSPTDTSGEECPDPNCDDRPCLNMKHWGANE